MLCKTKKTEKKESNQSTKLGPKQKPKQLTKTHAIPSIENFQEITKLSVARYLYSDGEYEKLLNWI